MISRIKNQVNLHAASEVLNEFIVSNKTFKECCLEYSIYNIGEIFSAVIVNSALNNFCQEKDENFDLTKNENYSKDQLSAYDFSVIKILNGQNYSHKRIIKEIRDGIEHMSYEIEDDYSAIRINNRRTGFIAEIPVDFFFNSFFSHLDASNYNSLLLDDRNIDYKEDFNYNLGNIKIFRLRALNKNLDRNSTHFQGMDLKSRTLEFLDETKYQRIQKHLDDYQISLLTEYFSNRKFSKESLSFALPAVQYDDSGFSNEQNRYFIELLTDLLEMLKKKDIKYGELLNANQNNLNMLETLNNFLKILFITDYYKNTDLIDDETSHLRNCLCHGRYTRLPVSEIILHDHRNGINNEEETTFIRKCNIDELYYQVERLAFDYDRKIEK